MPKIQIKRGLKANLPSLSNGEYALCTDTKEIFMGSNGGNHFVGIVTSLEQKEYILSVNATSGPGYPYYLSNAQAIELKNTMPKLLLSAANGFLEAEATIENPYEMVPRTYLYFFPSDFASQSVQNQSEHVQIITNNQNTQINLSLNTYNEGYTVSTGSNYSDEITFNILYTPQYQYNSNFLSMNTNAFIPNYVVSIYTDNYVYDNVNEESTNLDNITVKFYYFDFDLIQTEAMRQKLIYNFLFTRKPLNFIDVSSTNLLIDNINLQQTTSDVIRMPNGNLPSSADYAFSPIGSRLDTITKNISINGIGSQLYAIRPSGVAELFRGPIVFPASSQVFSFASGGSELSRSWSIDTILAATSSGFSINQPRPNTTTTTDSRFLLARDVTNFGTRTYMTGNFMPPFTATSSLTLAYKTNTVDTDTNFATQIGRRYNFTNASAITITIPTNTNQTFPIGTQIYFSRTGAGTVTISPDATVTLRSVSSFTKITLYGHATLTKIATNEWLLHGDIEA